MENEKAEPLLRLFGITKTFPGVKALDDVSLFVRRGEVMALIGENGAGKSTLVKILCGALSRDSGTIQINGTVLPKVYSPSDSRKLGIAIIYQELSLLSQLSIAENIYLTKEPKKSKILKTIDFKKMNENSRFQLAKLKADYLNVEEKVFRLSLPEKQMVEIAKALAVDCRVIIMDEPTTSLSWEETERLMEVIRELKKQDVTVIYISHRLDEVFQIADRATILRDGKIVSTLEIKDTNKKEVISYMTGRQIVDERPENSFTEISDKKEIFRVEALSDGHFVEGVSFRLFENEVLGIAGLVGSKRTEIARMIFGADCSVRGDIYVGGKKKTISNPAQAVHEGIGYLSENRKEEGLNLDLSLEENVIITDNRPVSRMGVINWSKVRLIAQSYIDRIRIKGHPKVIVKNLSGGNQQKVVISKWLHAGCQILIFDEPTRGVDVGAKAEIHTMIREFARNGKGAIVISSEVDELVEVSDRILVLSKGKIINEMQSNEITKDAVLHNITKGK